MDAMPEHGFRRQQSALLINMSVIARAHTHIKVMNFFDLLAIFREMSLQVGIETGGQFRGAAHQFFRTGNRKAWTESIFESAFFGPVPFATKPFALQQRNREHLFRLELAIRAEIHHRLAQDNAQSALLGGFEPDFATVFENRRIDHRGGGAMAGKLVEKLRRLSPRLWPSELAFDGKNVLAQPRKQFALASGDGGILRQMCMAIDEPGENGHRPPLDPADRFGPLPPVKISWQNETRLRFPLKAPPRGLIAHMCEKVGLEVVAIKRIRLGRVPMAGLPAGQWRYLLGYERF